MNKKLIRLTESDLHRIVKESVKRVLNEDRWNEADQQLLEFHNAVKLRINKYTQPSHLHPQGKEPYCQIGEIETDVDGGKYFDVIASKGWVSITRNMLEGVMHENGLFFKIVQIAVPDNNVFRVESTSLKGRFDDKYN